MKTLTDEDLKTLQEAHRFIRINAIYPEHKELAGRLGWLIYGEIPATGSEPETLPLITPVNSPWDVAPVREIFP